MHRIANGDIKTVELFISPAELRGKTMLFSIVHDISERIRIEQELHFSEARWQAAIEGSGDGVWDWNPITGEVSYSHQWRNMLGIDETVSSEGFGEWLERIHPDDKDSFSNSINKLLTNENDFYTHEHRMLAHDGSYKWVLDKGKIIECNEDGVPSRVIGTSKDISERKLFEMSLRQTLETEKELNEMKSRFVSIASHEFRTPLASILISADSLLSYWKTMEVPQINDRLHKIIRQVNHLTEIVNEVLQLSRIEQKKIDLKPSEVDIADLCNQVAETFNSDPANKNRVKVITIHEGIKMRLDQRLMLQVINNLVSNAVKFSKGDSVVKVEIDRDKAGISIKVTDHGIGISPEDQKHIFTPFFRGLNANSIQGNGLGLSIVKESVQLHGGTIRFTSESGAGSTFSVHLPADLLINK
jgi:PAS domain S-box-containing protein